MPTVLIIDDTAAIENNRSNPKYIEAPMSSPTTYYNRNEDH